jgi:hypothetical protein
MGLYTSGGTEKEDVPFKEAEKTTHREGITGQDEPHSM